MSESLFEIFGEHLFQNAKSIKQQPRDNIENRGKIVSSGPIKLNEPIKPIKPGETKKSFLSNTGATLQSTPARALSPKPMNMRALIYIDDNSKMQNDIPEEFEFTKPAYKYSNYNRDLFDYLPMPKFDTVDNSSPPVSPPKGCRQYSLELDDSYQEYSDEFYVDDFSINTSNSCIPSDDIVRLELD